MPQNSDPHEGLTCDCDERGTQPSYAGDRYYRFDRISNDDCTI